MNFNYENLGLHSLETLDEVKDYCILSEGVFSEGMLTFEECLSLNLFNFDVVVSSGDVVTLTTKKSFVIDGKLEKIGFSFIPA